MITNRDPGRPRVKRNAAWLAVAMMLAAAVGLSLSSVAQADTSGTPDPNTRASFGTANATTGQLPATTLAGAVGGETVNVHVDGVGGKFFGVSAARLCRSGLIITTSSQMSPSSFGNCIAGPLPGAPNDDFVQASAAPTNTSVDFTFRVGSGTESSHPGPGAAITCDATHPCALWLDESVDQSIEQSGDVFKHYDVTYAGAPGSPAVASTPSNQTLTIDLTAPASDGNSASALSYSVTVTGPGGATQSGTGTHYVFSGLTNFTGYTVSGTATSTAADGTTQFTSGATSIGPNASTTPVPPPPTNVQGVPGDQKVDLSWTAPAGPTPTSYDVLVSPTSGTNPRNTGSTATSFSFTGLTNGTVYTFQVRGVYSGTPGQYSAPSGPITPNGKFVTQTITVTRPQGDLVLTQVCGAHGATHTGSAPTVSGGGPDPNFPQYPYPTDANGVPDATYPTNCGINLGTAHFVTSGTGAGQFFEATGALNQVTVADTRDSDPGFTISGQMGTFTNGGPNPHDSFSGSELGWTPVKTSDSPAFTDSNGNSYDQTVTAGPAIAPNTPNATGLSSGGVLGSAQPSQGLGIAVLDANLDLFIPVFANHGVYTGTLTISAV